MKQSTVRLTVLLPVIFLNIVVCQIPHFGSCPSIQPMRNFSLTDFSGRWYEIFSYPVLFAMGRCISLDVVIVSEQKLFITVGQVTDGEFTNKTHIVNVESPSVWSLKFETNVSKF